MNRRTSAALVVLCAIQIVAGGVWLSLDEGVQFTDAAYHYSQIIDLRNAVLGGAEAFSNLAEHDEKQRYGILGYFVAAAVSLISGPEASSLLLGLSFISWPLLLFGSYLLASFLAPPEKARSAGLLGATLAGLLPGLFNYSRTLVLDLPLTLGVLWVIVGMLWLRRCSPGSKKARRLRWFTAAALAATLSIKLNALAFLVGPALVLFYQPAREFWSSQRLRSVQAIAATGVIILIWGAWVLFGPRGPAVRGTLAEATWPGAFFTYLSEGSIAAFPADYLSAVWGLSWEIAYYTTLQSFTPLLALPALAAYVWFFGRVPRGDAPETRLQRAAMFAWFIVPVLGLLLGLRGLYDERYLLPLLPQAAAILAVSLTEVPWPKTRRISIAALLVAGALNFAFVSFNILPGLRPLACLELPGWTATERVGGSLWTCAIYPEYRFMDRLTRPDRKDWRHEQLEQVLGVERDRLQRPLRAVFLDDLYDLFYRVFQRDLLRPDLYRHEDMLLVTRCWDEEWMTSVWGATDALRETISRADVLLMRWGNPNDPSDNALRGRRCTIFDERDFRLRDEFPLVDGTSLRVYFRR
jgi:hypothetical protein